MAQVTNAFDSYEAKGNREDLSDFIYDVSPTDTPFMSAIPKTTAQATKHEWQTDALASASDSNQQLEGDSISAAAGIATTRLDNQCEIAYKALAVTGTQEAVSKAGRKSELKYQILKRSKEIKRDVEASLLGNKAKNAGSVSAARVTGGILSWLKSNQSTGTGGSAPTGDGSDTRTFGTNRTFTEALLKSVLKSCWDNGGDPDCIMTSGSHKQSLSTFTGNATRFKGAEDKTLSASIEIYQSDFGDLEVQPNRFMFDVDNDCNHVLVLQKDMFALANLRAPHLEDLAKTGHAESRVIIHEFALESRNEAASGVVADLTA